MKYFQDLKRDMLELWDILTCLFQRRTYINFRRLPLKVYPDRVAWIHKNTARPIFDDKDKPTYGPLGVWVKRTDALAYRLMFGHE